jgi:type I restriction enzyme S subunit
MNEVYPLVPLGNVINYRKEFVQIDDTKTYKRCRVKLHAQGIVLRDIVKGAEIKTKKQQVCRKGEFLVAEIDAKIGGIGIVPENLDGAIVSSHYFLFEINESLINKQFLNFFIRSPIFCDQIAAQGSTNYAAIRPSDVLGYSIPLPPLEEQKRIVARVEELVGKIEEVRSLRQKALEETEALVNSSAAKVFVELDTADFYQIDDISEVKGGIQKSSARTPGANPRRYITVAHVQRNSIDIGDPRYFEVSDEELDRWKLIAGDVLVIEGNGSPDHIGRAALFKGEIENCVHQNHVIRIRPNTVYITPEYLNTYLNSPIGKDQMLELSRTTSGLYTLSVGRIKSIKLPVPPLPEQRRIVAYLDELQTKIDTMKQLREEAIKELDAILPSILDKAFKGEL